MYAHLDGPILTRENAVDCRFQGSHIIISKGNDLMDQHGWKDCKRSVCDSGTITDVEFFKDGAVVHGRNKVEKQLPLCTGSTGNWEHITP